VSIAVTEVLLVHQFNKTKNVAKMKQYQIFAIISMIFAGLTSVIAKAGLKNVGGDTGLAVRTSFVFVIIWLNIFFSITSKTFQTLQGKTLYYWLVQDLQPQSLGFFITKQLKLEMYQKLH